MAFSTLKKILIGFGFGMLFIISSGLFTGGILFADFLLGLNLSSNFMLSTIPYGFVAGFIYLLTIKIKGQKEDIVRSGILFGIGFWLSFSTFYIIGYFTFSGFNL